jgi:hypothetical protein
MVDKVIYVPYQGEVVGAASYNTTKKLARSNSPKNSLKQALNFNH